jgi:glyoxylase-like metal-dependent hydrolase (beta-lactamase superfamily II)
MDSVVTTYARSVLRDEVHYMQVGKKVIWHWYVLPLLVADDMVARRPGQSGFNIELGRDCVVNLVGGPEMGRRTNISYYLHPYDAIHPMDLVPARVAYRPLESGQTLQFGQTEIRVLHFPGHTLGMVPFLIDGRYLINGDSLFLESIARPDLGGKADKWAPLLYESLKQMIELPDETLVLPAHFSDIAVVDETGLYRASLGELKQQHQGLGKLAEGKDAFCRYILESLPEFPPAYVEIKRANAGLVTPDERKSLELELGKNICAVSK